MAAVTIAETLQQAVQRLTAAPVVEGYAFEALHAYTDADGKPIFWRIRCKHRGTGRKWIRPLCCRGSDYVLSEPERVNHGLPLYRLPELRETEEGAPVIVTEGEWCADHLHRLGVIATTSGSASSAAKVDWTPLRGRAVRIWRDRDTAGLSYAKDVTRRLQALDCAVAWIDVEALDLPKGGDAVDWLAQHPGATAAGILALPCTAPDFGDAAKTSANSTSRPLFQLILARGSEVEPLAVDWLWPAAWQRASCT